MEGRTRPCLQDPPTYANGEQQLCCVAEELLVQILSLGLQAGFFKRLADAGVSMPYFISAHGEW